MRTVCPIAGRRIVYACKLTGVIDAGHLSDSLGQATAARR